ncbi:MAG: imidazolonepropionase [Chloroflexi bacterium]|nr:imidazolonepropionase [Chloroflexota bacterium]
MLIHSASQLICLRGGPQRGAHLGELDIIHDGAVYLQDDAILQVGTSADLLQRFPDEARLDAQRQVVMPGFVDPHTHLIWAGDRANEFTQRLEGKSYMEIMAAGGGINATVQATRHASSADLKKSTSSRAWSALRHGTTTLEAKSGYALDMPGEQRLLEILMELGTELPLDITPTYLGAHAVPPEFSGRTQDYVDLLVEKVLPQLKTWWRQRYTHQALPFVDVFCEPNVFNLQHTRVILSTAKSLGYPLKIHADEFENIGGAALAAELGAVSADHLVKISAADIRKLAPSASVAVALPCTPFGLAESHYTPAREIIAGDGLLALASDLNPGTAWCGNMQFVIALACRYMKLTPAQALAAATINAAAAINRQDKIGSLEPGKQADLLILNVPDYRHLGYRFGENLVQTVIKKGKVIDFS